MSTEDKVLADAEHLMATLEEAREKANTAKELAGRIEYAIIQQIQVNGGTALPSETYICELVVKNTYDAIGLIAVKEELNETEMKHSWEEEWVEAKIHPGKFNTVKLKAIVNKRGGKAKQLFEAAQIPGPQTLKFERRA